MIRDGTEVLIDRMLVRPGVRLRRSLEWDRDLLLDLLGREPGNLGRHLRGHGTEVRIGIDRQLRPGIDAEHAGEHGDQHRDQALAEAKRDELVNH